MAQEGVTGAQKDKILTRKTGLLSSSHHYFSFTHENDQMKGDVGPGKDRWWHKRIKR